MHRRRPALAIDAGNRRWLRDGDRLSANDAAAVVSGQQSQAPGTDAGIAGVKAAKGATVSKRESTHEGEHPSSMAACGAGRTSRIR